jgi:hypothetical protein
MRFSCKKVKDVINEINYEKTTKSFSRRRESSDVEYKEVNVQR